MLSSDEPARKSIIALTGYMAAGKSTVGRSLAWLLKSCFVDLDCEIECRAQQTIREIFAQHGEAAFRALESAALQATLESARGTCVIALGGGTLVQPGNAQLLRAAAATVIFLKMPVDELLQRCRVAAGRAGGNPRPLAEDEEAFRALYEQRLPAYRKSDLVIDAGDKTPEQIAREIAKTLRRPA